VDDSCRAVKANRDAQGQQLLTQLKSGLPTAEIIERDDGYIDTGAEPGLYFGDYKDWWPLERRAIRAAKGRVLDIGCGAGRHALYLQRTGLDVTGIDASPGAVRVCRARGLKKVLLRPLSNVGRFKSAAFDTVLMLGNNFGLFGSFLGACRLLREIHRITSPDARIIVGTRNPQKTSNPHHLAYQRWNRKRGRMRGQIRFRVRFETAIGPWMDYLFVSPEEMKSILDGTGWEIDRLLESGGSNYFAIIRKIGIR
jgi:SAM-dependent methyltransferase